MLDEGGTTASGAVETDSAVGSGECATPVAMEGPYESVLLEGKSTGCTKLEYGEDGRP